MSDLIRLMRFNQWIKNIFVVLPLFFLKAPCTSDALAAIFLATFFFSIASSTVYIVNDIYDIEADKNHPIKSKSRPLASGAILKSEAIFYLGVFYGMLIFFFFIQPKVMAIISAYIILNYAYTFKLKKIPIIDAVCIAAGFVLRFYAGVTSLQSQCSIWLYFVVFFLCMSLILIKREQEMLISNPTSRQSLKHYDKELTTKCSLTSAVLSLICFLFYVITINNGYFILIFLLFTCWIARFFYLSRQSVSSDCPVNTFSSDKVLIVLFIGILASLTLLK